MIEEDSHIDNVYAWNENFKEIYIKDVPKEENGIKKNYFCLGCKRQMQAIKGDVIKQHFKHHVKPNSTEKKCTYRDETYRHFLAKTNAIDLKRIKVPAVYKYPPNKEDGKAFLIKEATFIEAHSVVNEHYIYENENGEISVSKNFNEKEDKYLFIKPDTIFLDQKGKPLLIIEFVATHRPDQNKLVKLKRLGIDAIQVSVPKSSPEDIRELFFKTNRTKWIYNHEESKTDYLQFSNSHSGGISEFDHEQRKLYEEGYNCRKAQLGDFIRTIKRLLESEHYREVEQNLRSEIRRVEGNTERANEELDELRRYHGGSGIRRHSLQREQLEIEERKFQENYTNLEERYLAAKGKIIEEQGEIDSNISTIKYQLSGNERSGKTIGQRISEETEAVGRLGERIEYDRNEEAGNIRKLEERIEHNRNTERAAIRELENDISREQRHMDELPDKFKRDREGIEYQIGAEETDLDREIESMERNIIKEPGEFERNRKQLEEKFDEDTKRIIQKIENGDSSGSGWYSKELSLLDSFRQSLYLYKTALELLERAEQKEREHSKKT